MAAVARQRILRCCLRARLCYNDVAALPRAWFPTLLGVISHTGGRSREQLAAFIAIAWSDATHDVCLMDASPSKQDACVLKHTPEALAAWATALRTRFAGRTIAVCLEQSRGPLIYARVPSDVLVLYPSNPATLAQYRQAFSPSRAQEDPRDADSLLELLRHQRDHLKAWRPDKAKPRTRPDLVEHRRRRVHDRTRLSKRMTARLKADFPQVLPGFDDIRTTLVGDFLRRWPTVEALKKVRPATRETFSHEPHAVRQEAIAHRIAAITEAVPFTTAQAVRRSSVLLSNALATQMKTTLAALHAFDDEIEQLCRTPAADHLVAALPGAGTVDAARLTAAMGTDRNRWPTGNARRGFSGLAPVVERRGPSTWIRWRYFCPKVLRQSFHEYAGASVQHSCWARAYSRSQRARGKRHQAAVRALACKGSRSI
jgi:transposase